MVQLLYTDEKLFEIAKESYQNMCKFCDTLDTEGYWKEPEAYLHQNIYSMLDMYLQALLLNLTIYCGRCRAEEKQFIINLPSENALHCVKTGDLPEETLLLANRLLKNPPILLQLCGVRDAEKDSFLTSYFMDSLLNILIAISMLSQKQSPYANKFISEYYEKIAYFLNEDQKNYVINNRYIFLKLSSEKFQKLKVSVQHVKEKSIQEAKKKEEIEQKKAQLEAKKKEEEEKVKREKEKAEKEEALRLAREQMVEIMRMEEEEKKAKELKEQEKRVKIENETKESLKVTDEEACQKENKEKVELKDDKGEEKEQNKKKEKSIFEYTDEELLELQKMGKLKIQAPRFLEFAKKERCIKKIEDQKVDNIRKEIDKINQAKGLQSLLEELNSLVGLEDVKVEINSLINLIKVRKMRESYSMPTMDITYHMVFTGNPGTGKTTVARLVAQIYKELGILSKGHLVEVDRSGLVAGYVGQTAMKVKEVIEKAIGGVLFIDEAYSLTNKNDTNDFGGEAIDTLVKMMEDHRDNLVVIVAGYKDEMDAFLKANTGLISRFNKFVDFKDYTNEQLMDILQMLADKSGVEMEEEAKKWIVHVLEEMTPEKKQLFGNGRGVRNTFENIMVKQANRIVLMDMPTEEELKVIHKEDVIDVL
ncbi:MAG: AAA family ATPase [Lachnospiraceae bacterium]|nr:AAA family ATPase [Lachnospiraceae bacterium]